MGYHCLLEYVTGYHKRLQEQDTSFLAVMVMGGWGQRKNIKKKNRTSPEKVWITWSGRGRDLKPSSRVKICFNLRKGYPPEPIFIGYKDICRCIMFTENAVTVEDDSILFILMFSQPVPLTCLCYPLKDVTLIVCDFVSSRLVCVLCRSLYNCCR